MPVMRAAYSAFMSLIFNPLPPSDNPFASWRGPVRAAIFDWAGTVLDHGCMAPVVAFQTAFEEAGVPITEAEARAPMGAAKREHIEMILAQPAVRERWITAKGESSSSEDVDDLYAAFLRVDAENCARFSCLIPGVVETMAALRERGIAIGSTTGYPRSIADALIPLAAEQGYRPDHVVTASEARSRPFPDMVLHNAIALCAPDVAACVVVDDSPSGLASARAAGMWAIGIVDSDNEIGLPLDAWQALDANEQARRRTAATARLDAGGAHYTIATIVDLPGAIDRIEARLAAGERP